MNPSFQDLPCNYEPQQLSEAQFFNDLHRYREIAPLFSVANSKQEFQALFITKGVVRGDVGSEKHEGTAAMGRGRGCGDGRGFW